MPPRLAIPSPFSRRLTDTRALRRLSVRDIGSLAACSGAYVSLLEQGRAEPTLSVLEGLAKALSVSPEWLAFGVGDGPVERDEVRTKEAPRAGRPRKTQPASEPVESPENTP